MRNIAYIILHSRLILTTLYLILVFISCLSVDVRNYIVQCSSDGNQVGNFRPRQIVSIAATSGNPVAR